MEQAKVIVQIAQSRVGIEWPRLKCMELVRNIYVEVGINIPLIAPHRPPPKEFNLTKGELPSPPSGCLIFLKNKTTLSPRLWTHVALIIPDRAIVHRSRFFGTTVTISSLDEAFRFYEFAESR